MCGIAVDCSTAEAEVSTGGIFREATRLIGLASLLCASCQIDKASHGVLQDNAVINATSSVLDPVLGQYVFNILLYLAWHLLEPP